MSKMFLLSVNETKKIPKSILSCGRWWWLRSPGCYSYNAMIVRYYGYVYRYLYNSVLFSYSAVRPALLLSSPLSDLNLERSRKGYIKLGHKENGKSIKWIDISEYIGKPCLLMKKPFEYHRFDKESNEYETSEIKKRLEYLDNIFFTQEEVEIIED